MHPTCFCMENNDRFIGTTCTAMSVSGLGSLGGFLEKLHLIQVTYRSQLPSQEEMLILFVDEAMVASFWCNITERTDDTNGSAKIPLQSFWDSLQSCSSSWPHKSGTCRVTARLILSSFDTLNLQPFVQYGMSSTGERGNKYSSPNTVKHPFWECRQWVSAPIDKDQSWSWMFVTTNWKL